MKVIKSKIKNFPWLYWIYLFIVLTAWFSYMKANDLFYILDENIAIIITMVFGSFIAGSSPEGSASIAYPIFTLYLDIMPDVARNFAFAIQSIGMTSASIFILNKKIKVDWNYIIYVTIGGLFGLVLEKINGKYCGQRCLYTNTATANGPQRFFEHGISDEPERGNR